MRIAFYGGKQAGMTCLLTCAARGHLVSWVFAEDEIVERAGELISAPTIRIGKEITTEKEMVECVKDTSITHTPIDLFVCAHGRKILSQEFLSLFPEGGINVHPCLSRFKGSRPIERLLESNDRLASVGVHYMTDKVDEGEVICEEWRNAEGLKTTCEVYNLLYPAYAIALSNALDEIMKKRPYNENLWLMKDGGSMCIEKPES